MNVKVLALVPIPIPEGETDSCFGCVLHNHQTPCQFNGTCERLIYKAQWLTVDDAQLEDQ